MVRFDVAFRNAGTPERPVMVFTIPAAIGRALREKQLNRAVVTMTNEGILVRPYPAGTVRNRLVGKVEIPESWTVEP